MPYQDDISKITNFAPYIETTPIRTLEMPGAQRQQQYNEGLQLIQQTNQQTKDLAGQMMRPVDQEYLNTKLSTLQQNLSGAIAGDLSNQGLVTSIGGAIKSVANDEFVKSAISSSASIRNQQEEANKAEKEGKSSPANIYNLQKSVNSYLTSPLKDDNGKPISFNGSYKPYFDTWKFAKDTFDSVKPGGYTFDDIYVTDPKTGKPLLGRDGKPQFSPIMIRHESEGRDLGIVTQTLNQIFSDPRVGQQLSLDGQYDYRNFDKKMLFDETISRKKQSLDLINNRLTDLNIKKALGQNVQSSIDNLTATKDSLESNFNNIISNIDTNPESVMSTLYQTDVKNRYTDMFINQSKKDLVMNNPGADFMFKLQQEANQNARQDKTLAQAWEIHTDNMSMEKYKAELSFSKNNKNLTGTGKDAKQELAPQNSSFDIIGTVQNQIDEANNNLQTSTDDFLFATGLNTPANNAFINNWKGSGGRAEAMKTLIENTAKANGETVENFRARWTQKALTIFNNTKDPSYELKASKQNLDKATTSWNITKPARELLAPMFKGVNFETIPSYVSPSSGRTFKVTKEDMMEVAAVIKGEDATILPASDLERSMAKTAKKSLEAKGKSSLIEDAKFANLHIDVANALGNDSYAAVAAMTETIAKPFKGVRQGILAPLFPTYNEEQEKQQQYVQKNLSPLREFALAINNSNPDKLAETLKSKYNVLPVVKQTLMTGEAEHDNFIKEEIPRIASAYIAGNLQNDSEDFSQFSKFMGDKNAIFDTRITPEGKVTILASDKTSGDYKGSMTVQPQEALNLGVDASTMFVAKEVTDIKNFMNFNGGKTYITNAPITDKSLYINDDAIFKKQDFPALNNTSFDAKVNIKTGPNGSYYTYVYIKNDKGQDDVINLSPISNSDGGGLERTILSLKQTITPNYINAMLVAKQ